MLPCPGPNPCAPCRSRRSAPVPGWWRCFCAASALQGLSPGSTGCSWPPGTGTPGGHWGSSCGTPWCPPTGAASTVPTACCWRPTAAAGPCGPARGRCLPTNWSWPPTVLRRFWSWTKPPCWKSSGTAPPTTVCCATGWSVPWRMPCGISARKTASPASASIRTASAGTRRGSFWRRCWALPM